MSNSNLEKEVKITESHYIPTYKLSDMLRGIDSTVSNADRDLSVNTCRDIEKVMIEQLARRRKCVHVSSYHTLSNNPDYNNISAWGCTNSYSLSTSDINTLNKFIKNTDRVDGVITIRVYSPKWKQTSSCVFRLSDTNTYKDIPVGYCYSSCVRENRFISIPPIAYLGRKIAFFDKNYKNPACLAEQKNRNELNGYGVHEGPFIVESNLTTSLEKHPDAKYIQLQNLDSGSITIEITMWEAF